MRKSDQNATPEAVTILNYLLYLPPLGLAPRKLLVNTNLKSLITASRWKIGDFEQSYNILGRIGDLAHGGTLIPKCPKQAKQTRGTS